MPGQLTKADLHEALHELRQDMATKGDIRDLIEHFNRSQGEQNEYFAKIDEQFAEVRVEFAAIKELLVFRHEFSCTSARAQSSGYSAR